MTFVMEEAAGCICRGGYGPEGCADHDSLIVSAATPLVWEGDDN